MTVKLMNFDINNIIKSEVECKKYEIKKSRLKLLFYLLLAVYCLIFLIAVPVFSDDILSRKMFNYEIMDQFILAVCYIVVLYCEFKNLWGAIKLFKKIHLLKKDLEIINSSDNKKIFDLIFKSEKQQRKPDILFCLFYNPDRILSLKLFNLSPPNLEMEYVDDACIVHKDLIRIDKKIVRTGISDIIADLYNEVVYYPYDKYIDVPDIINVEPKI